MHHRTLLWPALLALALAACDNEAPAPADEPLTSVAGAEAHGGVFTVKLEAATPDPPIRGDRNAWQFSLLEAGSPMTGCGFAVEPTMPAHGHGTNPNPTVTELGDGRYEMRPLNFIMPGEWHIAIRPDCDGVTDEIVVIVDIQS